MALDYLQEIKTYNTRTAWPNPAKSALLVIDLQEYFLPLLSPIIGNVLSLIESCRSKGIKIIYTRHGHKDSNEDGGMLLKWWGEVITMEQRNGISSRPSTLMKMNWSSTRIVIALSWEHHWKRY